MAREKAKTVMLAILMLAVVLLAADNIWLHCKCSAQRDELAALGQKLELHLNPPPGPTMKERAKDAYDKAKDAVKRGYQSVKEKFVEKPKE